jgi:hypothetical protein
MEFKAELKLALQEPFDILLLATDSIPDFCKDYSVVNRYLVINSIF